MMPLVSIISPTYMHESYIGDCIESVLKQTYAHWEQIIVDDGSLDQTYAIAQEYSALDTRIRVFQQTNKGPGRLADTYNFALGQARGELVAILEGDDYWPPEKLALQVAVHLADKSTIMSYGRFHFRFEQGTRLGPHPPFRGTIDHLAFLRHLLLNQTQMIAVTQMINRVTLERIGGFQQNDAPAAVDMDTLISMSLHPGNVCYIPFVLGYWRKHEAQSTNLLGVDTAVHNLKLCLETFERLPEGKKQALNLNEADIRRARKDHLAAAYFNATRKALLAKDRHQSYAMAANMWRYGNIKRKLQALSAYLFASLGGNYEPILQWFEPTSERRHV